MDVECRDLVKRREMLVVVVEVLVDGATGGVRGAKRGERGLDFTETVSFSSEGGGISSRILCKYSMVR